MFLILYCDIAASMFYADREQEHTWGARSSGGCNRDNTFSIIEVLCSTKHKKLNYGTYSFVFRVRVFHIENTFTKSRV